MDSISINGYLYDCPKTIYDKLYIVFDLTSTLKLRNKIDDIIYFYKIAELALPNDVEIKQISNSMHKILNNIINKIEKHNSRDMWFASALVWSVPAFLHFRKINCKKEVLQLNLLMNRLEKYLVMNDVYNIKHQ